MPGISSPGVGSGLPVGQIVKDLVDSELYPLKNKLDKQEASLTTQLSSFGLVKSALAKLRTTMNSLTDIKQFKALSCNVSNASVFGATVIDNNAAAGNYQTSVQNLASNHSLASRYFADSTSSIGSGSLTINFGSYNADNTAFTTNTNETPLTINILPGQDNLLSIRDAINNSGSQVRASIVQDSSGPRLTLVSSTTGAASAMQIVVSDNDANNTDNQGLSAFAYDPTNSVNSMTETIKAMDSQVIINGLSMTQSTNQLTTAIEGININLLSAQPGVPINLAITTNTSQISNLVNDFIKQFNETMQTIYSLTALTTVDKNKKEAGVLQKDSDIRTLKFALSSLIGQSIEGASGPLRSLADIGIKTNRQGMLEMDSKVFNNVMATNAADIGTLFAKSASSTDPNINVTSINPKVPAGSYKLNLTNFTPGSTLSGTLGLIDITSEDGLNATGTGIFNGLVFQVIAGSSGNRGSINVTDGVAVQFDHLLADYLDSGSSKGELSLRTSLIDDNLSAIKLERSKLSIKELELTKRYTKQFTTLDLLLSKLKGTADFLTQQLDNMPAANSKRK